MSVEQNLLSHMQHHNVKRWLLEGAKQEDAQTIYKAVKRMSERRLVRRLARLLADER